MTRRVSKACALPCWRWATRRTRSSAPTGKAIDARLEALGGDARRRPHRPRPRLRQAGCRVDRERAGRARPGRSRRHGDGRARRLQGRRAALRRRRAAFTAENPLDRRDRALINLNGTGSTRETWHVEIAADAPGFSYLPGDAIGMLPENDPALALELAEAVGLGADGGVVQKLRQSYDVTTLSRTLIEAYAKLTGRIDVAKLARSQGLCRVRRRSAAHRSVRDAIPRSSRPSSCSACCGRCRAGFTRSLRAPRRIRAKRTSWSAPCAGNRTARSAGALPRPTSPTAAAWAIRCASTSSRTATSACPRTAARPIVMIGAGTGVAPYRAFIEERVEQGAKGKSWLVVRRAQLHQRLPLPARMAGAPGVRRPVAHRRRLLARPAGEDLRAAAAVGAPRRAAAWVEDGAHIYVCGDEKGMAPRRRRDARRASSPRPRRAMRKPGAPSSRS